MDCSKDLSANIQSTAGKRVKPLRMVILDTGSTRVHCRYSPMPSPEAPSHQDVSERPSKAETGPNPAPSTTPSAVKIFSRSGREEDAVTPFTRGCTGSRGCMTSREPVRHMVLSSGSSFSRNSYCSMWPTEKPVKEKESILSGSQSRRPNTRKLSFSARSSRYGGYPSHPDGRTSRKLPIGPFQV